MAIAKANAESSALAMIEQRIQLEAKALEEATQREAVERMANEAIIARSEENKKATAAATARIRAALAAAEHSRELSTTPLLPHETTSESTQHAPDENDLDALPDASERDSEQSVNIATTRKLRKD